MILLNLLFKYCKEIVKLLIIFLHFVKPLVDVEKSLQNADFFLKLIDDENKIIFSGNDDVYIDTTGVLKKMTSQINRVDASLYRNQMNKITHLHSEKKNENLGLLLKKFIQSTLETIFRLNKASQTVLSNTGSDLYIYNCFNFEYYQSCS